MGGSSSTETGSIWNDLKEFFEASSSAEPRNRNNQSVPRNRNDTEAIRISSGNTSRTLNTTRDSYTNFRELRIRREQWNNNNLVVPESRNLITYDENYFPKALGVLLIKSIIYYEQLPSRHISFGETYKLFPIHQYSDEYMKIKKMITNKYIRVVSIEAIYNPFLIQSYQLKKKQKEQKFPLLEEHQLFHGTKMRNIDNICKNNLNWRLCGEGTGHRFGQGVSFSCNAMYAASYSRDIGEKVIFVMNVLIGQTCVGDINMKLPPDGYDTSLKNATDHIVVVKYEDNEFYPAYKIKFHIDPGYVPQKKRQNINRYRRAYIQNHSFDSDDYVF